MAKKKKEPETVKYRNAGATVPVRGKNEELCGQNCRLLNMTVVPWECMLDPRKPEKLQVTAKGALRGKTCLQSSSFIQTAVERARMAKLVGEVF
jgi:hypothetical protein